MEKISSFLTVAGDFYEYITRRFCYGVNSAGQTLTDEMTAPT